MNLLPGPPGRKCLSLVIPWKRIKHDLLGQGLAGRGGRTYSGSREVVFLSFSLSSRVFLKKQSTSHLASEDLTECQN